MLVEKPPADMAALLFAFSSMPPVVRRCAKELLDVIRDAVKKGLSSTAEEPGVPLLAASSEATAGAGLSKEDNDVPPPPPLPAPQSTSTSLWSRDKGLSTAATSSLFGSTITTFSPQPVYSTAYSSLFGSIPSAGAKPNTRSRFYDIVNKTHSTQAIAPTVPAVRELCCVPLVIFSHHCPSPLPQRLQSPPPKQLPPPPQRHSWVLQQRRFHLSQHPSGRRSRPKS